MPASGNSQLAETVHSRAISCIGGGRGFWRSPVKSSGFVLRGRALGMGWVLRGAGEISRFVGMSHLVAFGRTGAWEGLPFWRVGSFCRVCVVAWVGALWHSLACVTGCGLRGGAAGALPWWLRFARARGGLWRGTG
jgi:hypothetical protein